MSILSMDAPRRFWLAPIGVGLTLALGGCGGSDDGGDSAMTGQLGGIAIQGLGYQTETESGVTAADGSFTYQDGETVSFSVGELALGSVEAAGSISPLALADGAQSPDDRSVTNMAVLLQTLDHDGNLNNGIQITSEASDIVSGYAGTLTFDQETATFAASEPVTDLVAELNAAGTAVFDDTDPRDRKLRDAEDAQENLTRALSERRLVTTEYGDLSGFTTDDGSAWAWYGIPYATPPLGDLRWKPPVAPETWEGVRDAIAWGDQAAQPLRYEAFGEGGMSEDSLYLNVTVPKGYEGESLPVMVWFHGGGFAILTGNTKAFNNTSLPAEGVIVVTVVHRLGAMGYMAHPALSAESDQGASGNYGQLDLIAALEWVQGNIAAFGGDPDNVTIFGESGGGGKVLSLLHSPLAEGLFDQAIVQSGMAPENDMISSATLTNQEQEGQRLAEALGLENEEDVLAALRAVPWPELVQAGESISLLSRPNIDGWYATKSIREAFEAGEQHQVPIMTGANTGDLPNLITGLQWYMDWLPQAHSPDVFAYVFEHVPAGWRMVDVPSYHGIELVYVFDYPGSFLSHYLLGLTGHESPSPQKFFSVDAPAPDPAEYAQVSGRVMSMWASFARNGDPSVEGLQWPGYTQANDTYLRIGVTQQTEQGLDTAFPAP